MTAPSQNISQGPVYTVTEVCQLLRISRWTFYRLIQRRELRTITIGSRRLILRADLEAFLAERQQQESRS